MGKIRTLSKAIEELKIADPNCCLTLTSLRRLVRTDKIPYILAGNKYLIDLDEINTYLFNQRKGN